MQAGWLAVCRTLEESTAKNTGQQAAPHRHVFFMPEYVVYIRECRE